MGKKKYGTSSERFLGKMSDSRKLGISVMNQPVMGFAMVRSAHSLNPKSQESKIVRVEGKIFRIKELG
jgi:hypothetical protein